MTLDLLRLIVTHDLDELDGLELTIDELELFAKAHLHLTQVLNVRVLEHVADDHGLDVERRSNRRLDFAQVDEERVVGQDGVSSQYGSEVVDGA